MIELNSKTQQDFLNREWVQRLLDAGVDMSDAKYYIRHLHGEDFITDKKKYQNCLPTYTVSELLYKLRKYSEDPLTDTQISLDNLIESLASLLIHCHQKDTGIKRKDTGDISDK